MGNNCNEPKLRKFNVIESWDFYGNNFCGTTIIYEGLIGSIYLGIDNNKYIIEIEGKTKKNDKKKQQKFNLFGVESKNPKSYENKRYFIINNENFAKFQKDIELTKYNDGNGKLEGDIIRGNYQLKMNLDLYQHKVYKQKEEEFPIISNMFQKQLSKLKKGEDIISNSLCGMKNLMNTCYINSSFQILIHIPEFVNIITKNNDFEGNIISDVNSIFEQILGIYKEYNPIIIPSNFVKHFKSSHLEYNNYYQMDSEMFLETLISDINNELGVLGDKRKDPFISKKNGKFKDFLEYLKESEMDSHYEINDLFYTYFIHEKKCMKCGTISYYFDESPGLKLNFEKTKYKNSIDLYNLVMDNFKNPIMIKSSILCNHCKNCFYIIETTKIAKLPKILILSLQKTNEDDTKKIPWVVKYDIELGIRGIVDLDLCENECGLYEIFAINNHLGNSPNSGHYYSYIFLRELNEWFVFNDESVRVLTNKSYSKNIPEQSLNNYILFYKQKIVNNKK